MNNSITYLEGTAVSDSEQLNVKLSSHDLFLISDPQIKYAKNSEYDSKNTSYSSLSSQLVADMYLGYGFRQMAYEMSDDYSTVDHIHDYNAISVNATTPPIRAGYYSVDIAACVVNGKTHILKAQLPYKYTQDDPYVGQLKFIALPSLPAIDVNSPTFDGWVYPDGRSLRKVDFAQAYSYFKDAYGPADEGEFRIPNLIEFIQPFTVNSLAIEPKTPECVPLMSHYHDLQSMTMNGTANLTCSFFNSSGNGKGPNVHGASEPKRNDGEHHIKLKFDYLRIHGTDDSISIASDSTSTYPSYKALPVLMYIGKKNTI